MIEPRPAVITPPAKEPLLRVGIVLEEDRKEIIEIEARGTVFCVRSAAEAQELLPGSLLMIRAAKDPGKVEVSGPAGGPARLIDTPIQIFPREQLLLRRDAGLEVKGVIAGRGFHWKKELTQIFPGLLSIDSEGGFIRAVNEVSLEDYVTCVIGSEMGRSCPPEFMKAQAVAARSWALCFLGHKHEGKPYTICNDDDCQRYQGTTHLSEALVGAAAGCAGRFLISGQAAVCPAYYSKSCGGSCESPSFAFGFPIGGFRETFDAADLPAKRLSEFSDFKHFLNDPPPAIFCSPATVPEERLSDYLGAVDVKRSYFRWEYRISNDALAQIIKRKCRRDDIEEVLELTPLSRGASGRIGSLRIAYRDRAGASRSFMLSSQYEIRAALHLSFLYSSAFIHSWRDGKKELELIGSGWGHGVGLCQIGAVGMALQGKTYEQILAHYYPGYALIGSY